MKMLSNLRIHSHLGGDTPQAKGAGDTETSAKLKRGDPGVNSRLDSKAHKQNVMQKWRVPVCTLKEWAWRWRVLAAPLTVWKMDGASVLEKEASEEEPKKLHSIIWPAETSTKSCKRDWTWQAAHTERSAESIPWHIGSKCLGCQIKRKKNKT